MVVGREHRAKDTVDQAGYQYLFVVGTHFTFHETAGETSCCGELFFVFYGKGQKIGPFLAFGGGSDGSQQYRAAHAYDRGAGSLFGQYAGLNSNSPTVFQRNGLG